MGMVLFGDQVLFDRERKNLAILECIRENGSVTKVDISKATGQNLVTISSYVDNFLKKGLVIEKGLDVSTGGRRPTLLELNYKFGFAMGVCIKPREVTCLVTDLGAKVLGQEKADGPGQSEEELLKATGELIEKIIANLGIEKQKIQGIGVGLSGFIDQRKRMVYDTFFRQKFDLTTFVENEVTLATFSEKWLALEPKLRNVLYMFGDRRCGMILDGRVYRGVDRKAGTLGMLTKEGVLACGWQGTCPFICQDEEGLEVVSLAKKAIIEGVSSLIAKSSAGRIEKLSLEDIVEAAKQDDKLANRLLDETSVRMGLKVAYLVNIFAPQMVVIGGGLEKAGTPFIESVDKTMRNYAFGETSGSVRIIPSRLAEQAVALGGAGVVIQNTFIT